MYSDKDFEKLWFLYKTEGEPKGISINSFCENQGVSYERFTEWFRKTRKKIVSVQIEGMPEDDSNVAVVKLPSESSPAHPSGGILVTIQTRDGLHIRKTNLSYLGLKQLVEKLEGLC